MSRPFVVVLQISLVHPPDQRPELIEIIDAVTGRIAISGLKGNRSPVPHP